MAGFSDRRFVGLMSVLCVLLSSGCAGSADEHQRFSGAFDEAVVGPAVPIRIQTSLGVIDADLYPAEAPKTVENFLTLARKGYYDGQIFHRVIPDFMIQTGDPTGTGTGGPGYTFDDEFSPKLNHGRAGMLSMANAGPDTNGSQFFITVAPTPWLDGKHSVFGRVTSGLDNAVAISLAKRNDDDRPFEDIRIIHITVPDAAD